LKEHEYYYNDYSILEDPDNTVIAIDLETTGLEPSKDKICYVSMCAREGQGYVFSWPMQDGSLAFLMNPKYKKVFHHAKFDMAFLEKEGYVINNWTDTQIMAYHYDNRNSGRGSGLKVLASSYLDKDEPTAFKDLFPKRQNKGKTIMDVPVELVIPYAGDDAIHTYELWWYLEEAIGNNKNILDGITLDLKCSKVIKEIQRNGCKINTTKLLSMQQDCNNKMVECDRILGKWVPEGTNMNSTKQMQDLLFQQWKLPIVDFTDKGGFAVDDAALEILQKRHSAISFIRERRFYKKLHSTYLGPFAEYTREDGFVYGSLNQTATITGRLSSSNPNLQNIPVKHEMGQEFRNCWVSRFPGGRLVVADHSQIEMRVMAHFSEDTELIRAIKAGEDLHTATAKNIFGVKEPTKEQRGIAKTINFGVIYGMGTRKLAISLGISTKEADKYLKAFFRCYYGVAEYMQSQQEYAKDEGCVHTLLDRQLNIHTYDYSGTRAVNYPIQGSAAEILKVGMVNVYNHLHSNQNKYKSKMILQVHDELVLDCPPVETSLADEIEGLMLAGLPKLKVPLAVNVKVVESWGEGKD